MMERELGILMLDTQFPRIPGDVGNEASFSFPVRKKIVTGANPRRVVMQGDSALLSPFINAAIELEHEGVSAITTSCGFLAVFQKELANAVSVPVFTSSLLQANLIYPLLKTNQIIGILTANAKTLGARHFAGVSIEHIPKVVYGMENSDFAKVFVGNRTSLDKELAQREMVAVALRMVADYPEIGAVILECTNMPPYARAVQQAIDRPVYDIITLCEYMMSGIKRGSY